MTVAFDSQKHLTLVDDINVVRKDRTHCSQHSHRLCTSLHVMHAIKLESSLILVMHVLSKRPVQVLRLWGGRCVRHGFIDECTAAGSSSKCMLSTSKIQEECTLAAHAGWTNRNHEILRARQLPA